jgi:hypothetical protein
VSLRRLAALQWIAFFLGGIVWATQHIVGWGITEAECGRGGFGIHNDLWQGTLMGVAVLAIVIAEIAAVTVVVATRSESYEDPPSSGRIRFLAIAAVPANVIFLMIVLLDGFASIFARVCVQG